MKYDALERELNDILSMHENLLNRGRRMCKLFGPEDQPTSDFGHQQAKSEDLLYEIHEPASLDMRSIAFVKQMVKIGVIDSFPSPEVWTSPKAWAEKVKDLGREFLYAYVESLVSSIIYLSQFKTELAYLNSQDTPNPISGVTYIGSAGIVAAGGSQIGDINNTGVISAEAFSNADTLALAQELSMLWAAMKKEARSDDISADIDIGRVADAAKAASEGSRQDATNLLTGVGRWVLGVAEKIGVPVAATALTAALNLK